MVTSRSLHAASISVFAGGVLVSGCAPMPQPADARSLAAAPRPSAGYPVMAPLGEYLMTDRDAEVALARTAAPPAISSDATVLVLTRKGYETAVEGKNGFVCFVDRSWLSPFDDAEFWNPKKRGPTCMNAPAARSALPVTYRLTELALAGLSKDAILARMKESIAKKEFAPPEIGSMSYMMSKSQYLNDDSGHWHPHLMFSMPGEMNGSVWGANLPAGSAVFGGGEELPGGGRMPWTLFFVPVPTWSDGTPAGAHHA
ncbi:MAG TPA: hypothetical protein VIF09_27205 [Polyangiaceae bacterium]